MSKLKDDINQKVAQIHPPMLCSSVSVIYCMKCFIVCVENCKFQYKFFPLLLLYQCSFLQMFYARNFCLTCIVLRPFAVFSIRWWNCAGNGRNGVSVAIKKIYIFFHLKINCQSFIVLNHHDLELTPSSKIIWTILSISG